MSGNVVAAEISDKIDVEISVDIDVDCAECGGERGDG